jgi:hypothetical protein
MGINPVLPKIMSESDPFYEGKLQKMQLMVYLVPVLGALPGLWTLLYRTQASPRERSVSRLSVTLTLGWAIIYVMLWLSADRWAEVGSFRSLYANGILTTGYIVACLAMMAKIWQGKPLD